MHIMLCTCGVMYTSCMWYCVHVVLHTRPTSGASYTWNCVHIMKVVPCTRDVVHMLWMQCCVHMVLCTCCTYGTGVHVVLCALHTCVVSMRYYVYALSSRGIMTFVFIVLYSVCIRVGLYTRCRCMYCVVIYTRCRSTYCVVLYTGCRCMCGMSGVGSSISWCCMSCVVLCM